MENEEQNIRNKLSDKELSSKNNEIKKEERRLKTLFKKLPKNKLKSAENLIKNASFMSITLEDLMKEIKLYGIKETYMNGSNQFGFKESVESKTYNTMIKNYMNIIKQLNDMLPAEQKINEADEFDQFSDGM